MIYSGVDKRRARRVPRCIAHPDNDQGITEFEYYGKTVEEKAKRRRCAPSATRWGTARCTTRTRRPRGRARVESP